MSDVIEIGYKDEEVYRSAFVYPWHPKLISLSYWVYGLDVQMIYTCLYEARNYPSLHDPESWPVKLDSLRSFDLRAWVIEDPEIIRDMTNHHWIYDPNRPKKKACMWHDTGRGIHFHFQVHKNTQFNKGVTT